MPTIKCRDCNNQISKDAELCPKCGAPKPGNVAWNGSGVDWKSKVTFNGLPLMHVAFGKDENGKRRIAIGVIAIGQFAKGCIVIAQFGIGIIGITQFGIFAFGVSQFGIAAVLLSQFGVALWGWMQIGLVFVHGAGKHILTFL